MELMRVAPSKTGWSAKALRFEWTRWQAVVFLLKRAVMTICSSVAGAGRGAHGQGGERGGLPKPLGP